MPLLEHLAVTDDVQQVISSSKWFLTTETTVETVSNQLNMSLNLSSKKSMKGMATSFELRFLTLSNLGAQNDSLSLKKDNSCVDDELKIEDLNESNAWDVIHTRGIGVYKSSKRNKPAAMLARYNDSSVNLDDENSKYSTKDWLQTGQGSQKSRRDKLKNMSKFFNDTFWLFRFKFA